MRSRFKTWAKGKPEYENIFSRLEKAYEKWKPYAKHQMSISMKVFGKPTTGICFISYAA